ncbi:putative RING zinc finger domain superfamily protein [Zea mays]|uniref:RBR-type E3 ubiquitin transferase n=1 Tax=Zea mays TaxID=4577 RepID=B4FA87_MAIZE|nr:putative RING zinc finger domain superfamily protein [Zea mays]ACF79030.1 unknown [Zea mays]ACG36477.1 IBR domain containing protein [Zea mays]AQK56711.1 zinc finger (C3HC4-type RING finger) family protein [Zea mays]|eukprot:NP_001130706.1 putative RING zinc finger domain superfamily protein [Zea mays]
MDGGDDLAALHEQVALAFSAAISASDLDLAFQLQVAEAIQASLGLPNAAAPSSSSQAAPESSSDATYAFAVQAADLARAEEDRRDAEACRAANARAAANARVVAHDALFARDLAAIPEEQWDHDGDYFERPVESSPCPPFRVFSKGMASREVVAPRDRDPSVAVLAVAIYGPQGEEVLRIQKLVERFVGGRMMVELMALMEGLDAALGLGIRSVTMVTGYGPLYKHMLGIWRPSGKKVADMMNQVLSVKRKFDQCEVSLVGASQVSHVVKLARDSLAAEITKARSANAREEKRESCAICLEDTDATKIHAVEVCAHRFCFSCMKEHVKVKLLNGTLPGCPQEGCATKLSVEGSRVFLSPRLVEIMVQRMREGQIPPSQKVYCPYPRCSALMSLGEVIHPMQESSSRHTAADAATLRKCVKCRGSFCLSCKVPWHDGMGCFEYKMWYPLAHPGDAKLQNLARQRLWRQCVKCKHMIELAEGCYHMICVCGYEFCYTCGKEWKNKKASCSCPLWDERNIIRDEDDDDDEDDLY